MSTVRVELRKPIWNGGQPHIGIADWRLKNYSHVEAVIEYTRKDGSKSYPDVYRMEVEKLKTYPTQVVGSGTRLFVAPLSDWEVVQ